MPNRLWAVHGWINADLFASSWMWLLELCWPCGCHGTWGGYVPCYVWLLTSGAPHGRSLQSPLMSFGMHCWHRHQCVKSWWLCGGDAALPGHCVGGVVDWHWWHCVHPWCCRNWVICGIVCGLQWASRGQSTFHLEQASLRHRILLSWVCPGPSLLT